MAGALAFQLAVPLRASFGARVTGDEPFYLLTTESLLADGDLDVANQYVRQSYARFFDGSEPLWYQSVPRPDGVLLSPHNVGLSVLLLPAYALGGVDGAKAFLAWLAGLGIGCAYLLSRRLIGDRASSVGGAAVLGACAPWFVYAAQVYPEVPAGVLVTFLLWLSVAPSLGVRHAVGLALGLTGLMWLGAKYAPVAIAIGLLVLPRLPRNGRVALAGLSTAFALHYAWFHLATYGGLTPYAVNRLYEGVDTPRLVLLHWEATNRLYRLLGLWVDREFGLVRWSPILLLALPAAWLLVRERRTGIRPLVLVLGVQVLVAAFLAVTMRGWWFPGRMLVVVLPLLAVLVAAWLARVRPRWMAWAVAGLLGGATLDATWSVWHAVRTGTATLAVNPFAAGGLWLETTAAWFPLFTAYGWDTLALSVLWILIPTAAVVWVERSQLPASGAPGGLFRARMSA